MRLLLVPLAAALLAVPALADNPAPAPTAQQQAAIDACKAQGLAPGTYDFNACVNKILNPGATPPSPALQVLIACRSAGKALPACISKAAVPQAVKQQIRAAVMACRAQKLAGADLRACLKAQLSG